MSELGFAKPKSLVNKPYFYLQLEIVNNVTENCVFPASFLSRYNPPTPPTTHFLSHILVKNLCILIS